MAPLLKNFQNDVKNNLDLIKGEINRSVDVLTKAMERNVTSSIDVVKREVCSAFDEMLHENDCLKVGKLEERSSSMSSSLLLMSGDVDSLSQQSSKLATELNKLKSHTQRSVDASAGLRSNIIKVEGES